MCMITENVATVTAIIISFTMSAQLANSRDQQALYAQNALKGTCIALNCALCYTALLSACSMQQKVDLSISVNKYTLVLRQQSV